MLDGPDTSAIDDAADKVEEAADKVEEAVEQITDSGGVVIDDACIEKIADRVYDKIKQLSTEMVTAAQDVEEMVSESVAAKADEVTPPEDIVDEGEEVAPRRSHKLFARPGRKDS